MKRAALAALLLALAPVGAACGSDPGCDDVGPLRHRLARMSPEDPDYNSVNEDLDRAEAACNT